MAKRVKVKLFGAQGQRSIEVTTRGGFLNGAELAMDMVEAERKADATPVQNPPPDPTPSPEITPNPAIHKNAPTPKSTKNKARVHEIQKYSLKKKKIFMGEFTPDLPERCQRYANAKGCVLHMHTATSFTIFRPKR